MTRDEYNSVLKAINQSYLTDDEYASLPQAPITSDDQRLVQFQSLASMLQGRSGVGMAVSKLKSYYFITYSQSLYVKDVKFNNIFIGSGL